MEETTTTEVQNSYRTRGLKFVSLLLIAVLAITSCEQAESAIMTWKKSYKDEMGTSGISGSVEDTVYTVDKIPLENGIAAKLGDMIIEYLTTDYNARYRKDIEKRDFIVYGDITLRIIKNNISKVASGSAASFGDFVLKGGCEMSISNTETNKVVGSITFERTGSILKIIKVFPSGGTSPETLKGLVGKNRGKFKGQLQGRMNRGGDKAQGNTDFIEIDTGKQHENIAPEVQKLLEENDRTNKKPQRG